MYTTLSGAEDYDYDENDSDNGSEFKKSESVEIEVMGLDFVLEDVVFEYTIDDDIIIANIDDIGISIIGEDSNVLISDTLQLLTMKNDQGKTLKYLIENAACEWAAEHLFN